MTVQFMKSLVSYPTSLFIIINLHHKYNQTVKNVCSLRPFSFKTKKKLQYVDNAFWFRQCTPARILLLHSMSRHVAKGRESNGPITVKNLTKVAQQNSTLPLLSVKKLRKVLPLMHEAPTSNHEETSKYHKPSARWARTRHKSI